MVAFSRFEEDTVDLETDTEDLPNPTGEGDETPMECPGEGEWVGAADLLFPGSEAESEWVRFVLQRGA